MECPICQSDMQTSSFQKDHADDSEEGLDAFRLKCGHAFHTACLCRALRTDSGCPVCRHTRMLTVTIDVDGQIAVERDDADVLTQELTEDITTATDLVNEMIQIRKHTTVQKMRRKINKLKAKYRSAETIMIQDRAGRLDAMLQDFTAKHYTSFVEERSAIQKALQRLRRTELELLKESVGPEKYASMVLTMNRISPEEYTVENAVGNGGSFGPLRKSFWSRL